MRKPYHPPALSAYLPPVGNAPGYLMGATGPQGFGSAALYVAQIPFTLARQVILRHHYSHSIVNNSYLHLGVYREGAFEGVLQWGYALNPAGAGRVVEGTVQGQYLELNRMWVSDDAPRNTESRAMSYAIKYIRRACPSVAWVQSFADERCRGLGVVYQACSFLYLGAHLSAFYVLDGEVYHKINATARGRGGRAAYLRANIDRAQVVQWRQFRYLRFLKTDWRQLPALADAVQAAGWIWRGIVVWDKRVGRPMLGRFRPQCEYVVFATKGAFAAASREHLPGVFAHTINHARKLHLASKPVPLLLDLLAVTFPDAIVLDPFMGAGSAGEACVATGRGYVGVELSPEYFEVSRDRLTKLLPELEG